MADATGILVFGDAPDGQLASTAQELLAAGRSLADALNQELAIAVIGGDVADAPQQAIAHGADKAYAVTNPALGRLPSRPVPFRDADRGRRGQPRDHPHRAKQRGP